MNSSALTRFLKYISFDTASSYDSGTVPSTRKQLELSRLLVQELEQLGLSRVRLTDAGYALAELPATAGYENVPAMGLLAHVDTSPSASGRDVKPQITVYQGGILPLGNSGAVLDPVQFPGLQNAVGKTLVTTDGSTLLGADNKAGIAAIMAAAERIIHTKEPHGKICIAFTTDEEVCGFAKYLDLKDFGADFAYTVDGGAPHLFGCQNFNAATAVIDAAGVPAHPGKAKGVMINALRMLMEFDSLLPAGEVPEETEKMEGFFYLTEMSGDAANASSTYFIREFDDEKFEQRKQIMRRIADEINRKCGKSVLTVTFSQDLYRNMDSEVRKFPYVLTLAEKAASAIGLSLVRYAIRGGTDGASLSHRGLPCPNLGTGGYNCHSIYEYLCVEELEQIVDLLTELIRLASELPRKEQA